MNITLSQGCFSFLPPLSQDQVKSQLQYCLMQGWGVGIEYTDDPHPRNSYWEMWGNPNFKATDAAALAYEIRQCCAANPASYVKITAFDNTRGVESCTMAFLVQRPMVEPGFRLVRQEGVNRNICYTIESYTQQYGGA